MTSNRESGRCPRDFAGPVPIDTFVLRLIDPAEPTGPILGGPALPCHPAHAPHDQSNVPRQHTRIMQTKASRRFRSISHKLVRCHKRAGRSTRAHWARPRRPTAHQSPTKRLLTARHAHGESADHNVEQSNLRTGEEAAGGSNVCVACS